MSKTISRFAHLMGLGARAEEPDPENQNAEEEYQENSTQEDQDAEDPKEQNGRAKGRKAKGKAMDDDPDAQDDQEPDAAEEGDDESDAEDEDDEPTAQARARERGRCAAIFGCKAATNNLALAAELAFGTNIPRNQAIRLLKAGGIAKPAASNKSSKISTYDQRMARSRQTLSVGASQPSKPQSKAANILQAAAGTGIVKKERQ